MTVDDDGTFTAPPEPPQTIDDVMALVSGDIAKVGVGKGGTAPAKMGGYKFRMIDDVIDVIGPIMAARGLSNTVKFSDRRAETVQTRNEGTMTRVVVTGKFTYRWKGQKRSTTTFGEATDSGDKATNKAESAATKYAHVLTFKIPHVGLLDTEADGGGKKLNDTKDAGEPAGRMSDREYDAWKLAIDATKTKEELRLVISDAFAKAREYGDAHAHADLKKYALEAEAGMPA